MNRSEKLKSNWTTDIRDQWLVKRDSPALRSQWFYGLTSSASLFSHNCSKFSSAPCAKDRWHLLFIYSVVSAPDSVRLIVPPVMLSLSAWFHPFCDLISVLLRLSSGVQQRTTCASRGISLASNRPSLTNSVWGKWLLLIRIKGFEEGQPQPRQVQVAGVFMWRGVCVVGGVVNLVYSLFKRQCFCFEWARCRDDAAARFCHRRLPERDIWWFWERWLFPLWSHFGVIISSLAFLPRFKWVDRYHYHVCLLECEAVGSRRVSLA